MTFETFASHRNNAPLFFSATATFETKEEAEACAAQFPKFVGVKVLRSFRENNVVHYNATLGINFISNDANKGKNETGIKRINKFFAIANTVWVKKYANTYATREEFEAAL